MNPQLCVRTGSRGPQGFPFALSEDRWYDSSGAGRGLPLELAPQALIRERRSVDDSREDMAMVDRSHRECGRGVWGVPLAILALGLCVAPSAGAGDKVAPGRRAGRGRPCARAFPHARRRPFFSENQALRREPSRSGRVSMGGCRACGKASPPLTARRIACSGSPYTTSPTVCRLRACEKIVFAAKKAL